MNVRARLISFYLPQFHPIPENDRWWGKGFTEWTNVSRAKPLFKGHYQPRLPADLGFYDLRVPDVREAQAELARNAGIEGFCYYHYWFGGKQLLARPFNEVLASGKPVFPFCLCWANQSWTGVWYGAPDRTLIDQTYSGREEHRRHFLALRNAFLDERYLRINDRPIFVIFRPNEVPDVASFIDQWQELAVQNGLPGLHFVAHLFHSELSWDFRLAGFDSCVVVDQLKAFNAPFRDVVLRGKERVLRRSMPHFLWRRYRLYTGRFGRNVRLYRDVLPFLLDGCSEQPDVYPCVIPNWDNTPRSHTGGYVLHESTPELFRAHLRDALDLVESRDPERRLVFLKSWNEWGEGNYLEPDQKFGHDYLMVIRQELLHPETGLEQHRRESAFSLRD
jgi:lipopolysaccharide biosynthesis protein